MDAEDRDRTGTVVTYRRILSPVRLPIPPPRHGYVFLGDKKYLTMKFITLQYLNIKLSKKK